MTTEDLARPRLAPWITVHPPMNEDAPWIVERPGRTPLRVSADAGTLLSALDGRRTTAALAAQLGPQWTAEQIGVAAAEFRDLGLLWTPGAEPPAPEGRISARSWTTLQLRLVRGATVFAPVRRLLIRLRGRAVLTAAALACAGGALTLVARNDLVANALSEPLPLLSVGAIYLGLIATNVVHELSHGATLTHYQGNPGWLGVMLFYLTPACFCEVTDGWRLAKPRHRVMVALAGVVAHVVVGSTAAMTAALLPDSDLRTTVIRFALACYLIGIVNLVPWIKLDGYLALMSALDIPRLRDRAMADARGWLRRRVLGVREDRDLPGPWVIPYGLLCIIFPVVAILWAIGRWSQLLLLAGTVGAVLKLLLIAFLGYRFGRGAIVVLRDARRDGIGWPRLAAAVSFAGLVVAVPLTTIDVDDDVRAGYVKDGTHVRLVLPAGSDFGAVQPGGPVFLRRSGLLFSTELGTARIGPTPPAPERIPAGALLPVRTDSTLDAVTIPLRDAPATKLDDLGDAVLPGPSRPLGSWLLRNHVFSAWTTIFAK